MSEQATPSVVRPVVRLEHVSRVYHTGIVSVPAIQDISLEIAPRLFNVIVGPSGSGKTTLLYMIGCIDVPDSGRIEVCGEDIPRLSDNALSDFRARHIGYVFQAFNLIPVLSAFENVEYPLLLLNVPVAERRRRVSAMLDAVGLTGQAKHRPNELSGGQKQRVAIARALIKEPSLVLADEPTANLDSVTGAAVIALMRRMQESFHTSFIFCTHDPRLMAEADQTFSIRDGMLV
jgi:putative ABC transport system ATP-binding protein